MPRMVEGQVPPALIWLLALASGVERVDRAEARRREGAKIGVEASAG